MATTYKFKANNEESYNSLAAYAVALPVTVTLFPQFKTIAIPEEAKEEVSEFVNNEALDFIIGVAQVEVDDINELLADPTSDPSILRDIAESFRADVKASADLYNKNLEESANLSKELAEVKKDKDNYYRWWKEESNNNSRVREQVKAISVLIKSIYPD